MAGSDNNPNAIHNNGDNDGRNGEGSVANEEHLHEGSFLLIKPLFYLVNYVHLKIKWNFIFNYLE